jgi:general secretion pathway protein A
MLARPELEQLAQRVIARYHLDALTAAETAHYVRHRCEVAGLSRPLPFDRKALRRIYQLARGVPRRINLLCDRALLGAFANSQAAVDRATVNKAAAEVFDVAATAPTAWRRAAVVLGLGLLAGAGLYATVNRFTQDAAAPPLAMQPAPAALPDPAASAPVVAAVAQAPLKSEAAPPALLRDRDEAWRELAQSWKVEPGERGEPCKALQPHQLDCFSRNLNLALIRELGRPGILTLDAGSGAPSYALLMALTRESATLRAAGTEQTVTLAALAARWQGDFATLWRVPPGYSARTASSPSGETLEWIAAGLAAVNGSAPAAGQRTPNAAALRSQLRSFQLSQGLVADGQVGPMTYMQLNRVAGVDEPRLRTEP